MNASYRIAKVTPTKVFLIDNDDGHRSVTNDAEAVVEQTIKAYSNRRIIYRDTCGNWDELVHAHGSFVGFARYTEQDTPNAELSKSDNMQDQQSKTEGLAAVALQPLVMPHDLMLKGGKWLAAAREWLQWNRLNGDSVTWGSHDILRPAFTVRDVELMAAHIAAAAINEERERVRHNAEIRRPGTVAHEQARSGHPGSPASNC